MRGGQRRFDFAVQHRSATSLIGDSRLNDWLGSRRICRFYCHNWSICARTNGSLAEGRLAFAAPFSANLAPVKPTLIIMNSPTPEHTGSPIIQRQLPIATALRPKSNYLSILGSKCRVASKRRFWVSKPAYWLLDLFYNVPRNIISAGLCNRRPKLHRPA